jgi:hypothetical protein
MNTPLTHRLVAAVASASITAALLAGVFAMARPPAPDSLLAQAGAATPVVR